MENHDKEEFINEVTSSLIRNIGYGLEDFKSRGSGRFLGNGQSCSIPNNLTNLYPNTDSIFVKLSLSYDEKPVEPSRFNKNKIILLKNNKFKSHIQFSINLSEISSLDETHTELRELFFKLLNESNCYINKFIEEQNVNLVRKVIFEKCDIIAELKDFTDMIYLAENIELTEIIKELDKIDVKITDDMSNREISEVSENVASCLMKFKTMRDVCLLNNYKFQKSTIKDNKELEKFMNKFNSNMGISIIEKDFIKIYNVEGFYTHWVKYINNSGRMKGFEIIELISKKINIESYEHHIIDYIGHKITKEILGEEFTDSWFFQCWTMNYTYSCFS